MQMKHRKEIEKRLRGGVPSKYVERWTDENHRATFVSALDAEIDRVSIPNRLDREYVQLIDSLSPFDFEALFATLLTRLGYSDVSALMKGGDEGVDVLGRHSARLLTFNVAAQCKHSRNPKFTVGRPVLDQLRTALEPYRCQAGIIVTNARISSGALDAQVAYDRYSVPVRCIDGEQLRKLLFATRVGVRESAPGEFIVDPEVWQDQFNLGKVKRVVSTVFVPQADDLLLVKKVVRLVAEGYATRADVARGLGYAARQGHYYAVAAEALGFILLEPGGRLSVAAEGHQLLLAEGDMRAQRAYLRAAVRKIPVYERMIEFLRMSRGRPITYRQLRAEWTEVSGLTGSTVHRRLLTLLSWFEYLGIISKKGGGERVVVHFEQAP